MIILFKYIDNDVIKEVQRHSSVVPAKNDSVWIITSDDVEQEYTVFKREWSFYDHSNVDTDLSITIILDKQKLKRKREKNDY